MVNINLFKHREVQDLAWVIASPPLVSGTYNGVHWWSKKECQNEFNDCFSALVALDKNPEPLIAHLNQLNSKRLGLRFESYISFWLEISPNYKLLAQNIQIIESGHTYGELDFIMQDIHNKRIIHLEVAVKFYLGKTPFTDPYSWYGTNTNDQLGKKLDHLKNYQTQRQAPSKNFDLEIDDRQCFLKGRLFYPVNHDIPPDGVTKSHLRGIWLQGGYQENNDVFYSPIEKSDWLAQLSPDELLKRTSQKELSEEKRAKCYVLTRNDRTGTPQEKGRVFNLPSDFWDTLPKQ